MSAKQGDRQEQVPSTSLAAASGLVCTGQGSSPEIPFCPENYCCAVNGDGRIDNTNPSCQPGCNGGAASICGADMDPGACYFADGGSLEAALALDDDAGREARAGAVGDGE